MFGVEDMKWVGTHSWTMKTTGGTQNDSFLARFNLWFQVIHM